MSAVAKGVSSYCPQRGVSFPVSNDLPHQRYLLNVTVGTPPQPFSLIIDTASADFLLPLPNSTGCAPEACPLGSYDPADSQSSRALGTPYNAIFGVVPSPETTAEGAYFSDSVEVGGLSIPNMTVATANFPPALFDAGIWGIIGLGSPFQESLYNYPKSPVFGKASGLVPTLWEQLYLEGYSPRRLFSVWLNQQSAAAGTIEFGGIDDTKYYGDLKSVPLNLNPQGNWTSWNISLTSVAYSDGEGRGESWTEEGWSASVILDTAAPNMYLPSFLYESVAKITGAQPRGEFSYVPCTVRNSSETLRLGFGEGSSGPQISVPFGEIVYPFGLPANIGEVRDDFGAELCYLGVNASANSEILLLGATFIRSAYVVFDIEGLQVQMAQAKYD
ncbi:hypothetical protein JX266_001564 [Neoarthrinium moseri]|nr:hypothetical protein JX266_001564 [Neoarthrinium moseri]